MHDKGQHSEDELATESVPVILLYFFFCTDAAVPRGSFLSSAFLFVFFFVYFCFKTRFRVIGLFICIIPWFCMLRLFSAASLLTNTSHLMSYARNLDFNSLKAEEFVPSSNLFLIRDPSSQTNRACSSHSP